MPIIVEEGHLCFEFPDGWQVHKYDGEQGGNGCVFYRNQFQKVNDGIKALDIIAIDKEETLWLIEVKDYRQHSRTKPTELVDEMALKVLHTLAALLPMKLNGTVPEEIEFAKKALCVKKIRVVLHLEQPELISESTASKKKSKASPSNAVVNTNTQEKLRGKLKAIDAHPKIVNMNAMQALRWEVRPISGV